PWRRRHADALGWNVSQGGDPIQDLRQGAPLQGRFFLSRHEPNPPAWPSLVPMPLVAVAHHDDRDDEAADEPHADDTQDDHLHGADAEEREHGTSLQDEVESTARWRFGLRRSQPAAPARGRSRPVLAAHALEERLALGRDVPSLRPEAQINAPPVI